MRKGHSPLGKNSTTVHKQVAGPRQAPLELSTTMRRNPLLDFTVYLAAGRSGVLILWLPCLLGKSKVPLLMVRRCSWVRGIPYLWHFSLTFDSLLFPQAVEVFLAGHSLSTWPSFPHATHTCLYQQLLACLVHFPWLNNRQASLLLHADPLPCCVFTPVRCAPCGARLPAALLKMCHTSRNWNFSNWSSDTLLTDPDHCRIALSRLRTRPCLVVSEEAKYAVMYSP